MAYLKRRKLIGRHLVYRYFAAESLYQTKQFEECAETLEESNPQQLRIVFTEDAEILTEIQERLKIQSACSLLLARCFLQLEKRDRAAVLLQRCLKEDPFCFEALDLLLKEHLLSLSELAQFVDTQLKFPSDAKDSQGLGEISKFLYLSKLHTEAGPPETSEGPAWSSQCKLPSENCPLLSKNLSVRLCDAQCLYYRGHYKKAYEITRRILDEESFLLDCIPLHVSLLVELERKPELFRLAHKMVDMFPDLAVSWYSVGAYYYLLGHQDGAKKFLVKMTGMRPTYGPGWLLLGHSFAAEQEHDQAINCYLKATKLLSGCHLPLMYVGVEYGMSQNLELSQKFLQQAEELAPNDPFVENELGALALKKSDHVQALRHLLKALEKVVPHFDSKGDLEKELEKPIQRLWEPILTNLGNAYLHIDTKKAVVCQWKALQLAPGDSRVMGNLGLAHLANLGLENGIDWLHRSLLIRSETVYSTLLSQAMAKMGSDNSAIRVSDSEKDRLYYFHSVPCLDKSEIFKIPAKSNSAKKHKEPGDDTGNGPAGNKDGAGESRATGDQSATDMSLNEEGSFAEGPLTRSIIEIDMESSG